MIPFPPHGIGKTTLIQHVINTLDAGVKTLLFPHRQFPFPRNTKGKAPKIQTGCPHSWGKDRDCPLESNSRRWYRGMVGSFASKDEGLKFMEEINILGFIPFGFFFSALLLKITGLRRLSAYLLIVALGTGLSFTIELIQPYLPTRGSSLTDVL